MQPVERTWEEEEQLREGYEAQNPDQMEVYLYWWDRLPVPQNDKNSISFTPQEIQKWEELLKERHLDPPPGYDVREDEERVFWCKFKSRGVEGEPSPVQESSGLTQEEAMERRLTQHLSSLYCSVFCLAWNNIPGSEIDSIIDTLLQTYV
jgi:hypothetical protein